MKQQAATATAGAGSAGSLYDRFAHLYDITFKFNGYGRSLERYLREYAPELPVGAHVLDAGCGTGLLTLALLRTLPRPATITALDLSAPSLAKARAAIRDARAQRHQVQFMQGNVLALPFAAASFDFVVTSGALEYVPLAAGLAELARVIRPGGHLLHLPVRPALASRFLELLFRFKSHPPHAVTAATRRHFRIVSHYRFPPLDIIGWTKSAIMAQKP